MAHDRGCLHLHEHKQPDPDSLEDAEMRARTAEMGCMIKGTDDQVRKVVSKTAADQYVGQYQGQVQEAWHNAVRQVEKKLCCTCCRTDCEAR